MRGLSGHDPERLASAYLVGDLRPKARRRFEAHLVDCDECWREVRLGRSGRRLAEAGRELAPSQLRERVRAAVAMTAAPPRRRLGYALLPIAVVVVVALLFSAWPPGTTAQPEAISAALASYRSDSLVQSEPASQPAPDLAQEGLLLAATGRVRLDGMATDAYAYRDAEGARVMVFLSAERFPTALGAKVHDGTVHGWHASDGGTHLACGDAPVSYLVVGSPRGLVLRAEAAIQSPISPVS